jgi:hypothetical protein
LQEDEAGLELIGWLGSDIAEKAACEHAASYRVDVRPLCRCRIKPGGRPGLMLGFAQ